MKTQTLKMACFSPTGTTKAILENIGKGIQHKSTILYDITKPGNRVHKLRVKNDELLIIAVPVYMGRVPLIISDWLMSIRADHSPVVCVVVYGNRAFDDALLELHDMMVACGCIPVAAAAFVGEHSFSGPDTPSSPGRPDASDLQLAVEFGRKIKELITSLKSADQCPQIVPPGNSPYGGTKHLWHLDFIHTNHKCSRCGKCADGCPAGAIDKDNTSKIDTEKCTLCCACIRHCPNQAKSIKDGPVKEAAIRCTKFTLRKEPEFFYP